LLRIRAVRMSNIWLRLFPALLMALSATGVWAQHPPQDLALLDRGRYLVETAAFCGACHTTRDYLGSYTIVNWWPQTPNWLASTPISALSHQTVSSRS